MVNSIYNFHFALYPVKIITWYLLIGLVVTSLLGLLFQFFLNKRYYPTFDMKVDWVRAMLLGPLIYPAGIWQTITEVYSQETYRRKKERKVEVV